MIGRIVPYSEVFISVTLSLDEAAALSDYLEIAAAPGGAMKDLVQPVLDLQETLTENLKRAEAYKARRAT